MEENTASQAPKNYGLLHQPIVIGEDYVLGGYGSLGGDVLQPDGDWSAYLPGDEFQNLNGIEPSACATFGTLNCVETLLRRLGLDRNYSDRFLAKASGTTAQGNSPHVIAEYLRKNGDVLQEIWPFDATIKTFADFYADIPRNVYALATAFIDEFDFKHEYIPTDPNSLKSALKLSPVGFSVYAWVLDPKTGYYVKPQGVIDNHWVECYGCKEGEYWNIFDSYDNTHKKVAWNALPQIAKRYSITRVVESETWWQAFLRWLFRDYGPQHTPVLPPSVPQATSTPPTPTPTPPAPQRSLLRQFCLAIQAREGYEPPNPKWPHGTPAYYNCNPGNLRCGPDKSTWNRLAIGTRGGFCVFSTYESGFQALINVVTAAAQGQSAVYKPTDTLLQFFSKYSPSNDGNDPVSYAKEVGAKLGVDYKSFTISQLL
jgi:hypothetical protein